MKIQVNWTLSGQQDELEIAHKKVEVKVTKCTKITWKGKVPKYR